MKIVVPRLSFEVRGNESDELPAPVHTNVTRFRTARFRRDEPGVPMNPATREGVPLLARHVSSTADDAEVERGSRHCDGAHRAYAGTRNASGRPIEPRGIALTGFELRD